MQGLLHQGLPACHRQQQQPQQLSSGGGFLGKLPLHRQQQQQRLAPQHAASGGLQQQQQQQRGNRQRAEAVSVSGSSGASSSAGSSPSSSGGRETYKPPTFKEIINDASIALIKALKAGEKRLEVEFPVLPGQDNGYKGSSDAYIDAAVQLALAGARKVTEETGKRVHIIVPDETEYKRSARMFRASLELSPGVTMGFLNEGKRGLLGSLGSLFSTSEDLPDYDPIDAAKKAEVFFAINASTVELADIERYTREVIGPERTLVMWCLELDTLRADLGLLGFPPKSLQFEFLSTFRPVFYMRLRDYSKSVAVAPFIINYSGMLFREYPGPWQCMLRQDNGVYACVAEGPRRYNLGDFKEQLGAAMGLNEGETEAMTFLRRGYKTSTWWEDGTEEEVSDGWRT